ncbi:MAG TPA: type 4a pilus biogenesis protein PilO [Syntrophobacter fumaroxidans]|mgnify:CR=1 FL=1|nr:type 4a pilus biogenesis protein PilO [Syntrophobacter fumaroxidans]
MKKSLIPTGAFTEKLAGLPLAQKALLFLITLAILGAGFYYLVYEDQEKELAKVTASVAEQQKKLASLKEAAARVDKLQKELAASEADFNSLLALLPDQKEIPGLLESVSQLGAKVGLENVLFQPQPEQPKEFYSVIPIRLDLLGSFNDLEVFLDNVSKLNRILKVETLTLNRVKDKGSGSGLQVGCTIVTYRFVDRPVQKDGKKDQKKK